MNRPRATIKGRRLRVVLVPSREIESRLAVFLTPADGDEGSAAA